MNYGNLGNLLKVNNNSDKNINVFFTVNLGELSKNYPWAFIVNFEQVNAYCSFCKKPTKQENNLLWSVYFHLQNEYGNMQTNRGKFRTLSNIYILLHSD